MLRAVDPDAVDVAISAWLAGCHTETAAGQDKQPAKEPAEESVEQSSPPAVAVDGTTLLGPAGVMAPVGCICWPR